MAGTSLEAVELPGLGRELLEGVEIDASPGFTAWLLGERRRLQALGEAVLREGALRALASGNARTAVELATRLVAVAPLNEDAHVLLIRAFAGTGDGVAVERQLSASIDLFEREFGVEPGPELAEAAVDGPAARTPVAPQGVPALQALLESGEAAVSAGAVEAGLEDSGSRRWQPEAGETEVEAAAQLALGSALIHATKGKDEEGAAALHRSITAAETRGNARSPLRPPRARLRRSAPRRLPPRVDLAPRGGRARRRRPPRARQHPRGDRSRARRRRRARTSGDRFQERSGSRRRSARRSRRHGHSRARTTRCCGTNSSSPRRRSNVGASYPDERWTAFLAYPEALLAEVWVRRATWTGRPRPSSTRSRSGVR